MSFVPLLAAKAADHHLVAENDKPAWAAEATMNPDYKDEGICRGSLALR
jgi:hypothetical protein